MKGKNFDLIVLLAKRSGVKYTDTDSILIELRKFIAEQLAETGAGEIPGICSAKIEGNSIKFRGSPILYKMTKKRKR